MLAGCAMAVAACGPAGALPAVQQVMVSPENTSYLVGPNRISIALLDSQRTPLKATNVRMQVLDVTGTTLQTRQLHDIGPEYGGISTYVGSVTFPDVGQYQLRVQGNATDGRQLAGDAYVTVALKGSEVPVGSRVPLVRQAILGQPGVTLAMIDSGVPADNWHGATVADGVAQHRPMVLFFGDPSYCPSKTCGPTHQILEQLCTRFCSSLLFEHIETYLPAGPPSATAHVNPAFTAFGLETDPWIYFVTATGVVSDRYEGPVTLGELTQSAEGTLAGHVPAVPLS